jgi:hypothetical protein
VDYSAWECENQELEDEYSAGDLGEEEYHGRRWQEVDLRLGGGWVAVPRMEGPGICRPHMYPAITPLLEVVRVRGRPQSVTRAEHRTGG